MCIALESIFKENMHRLSQKNKEAV